MITAKIRCEVCQKELSFISNTHLKIHGLTIAEYKELYPNSKIKTDELRLAHGNATRGKTYEEIYGKEKSEYLRATRRQHATAQMQDSIQINIRKEKCGKAEYYTDSRRKNMSNSITTAVIERRKETVIRKLINGEYKTKLFGRQSSQARNYIRDYIFSNKIDESRCYFDGGGITGNEYYSIIQLPDSVKKKSIAFDLVILDTLKKKIDCIIEINGPWHYRAEDVIIDPHSPSCPLKTNKYTKLESYNIDALKINKALEISNEVYIFWLDNSTLEKIEQKIKLI